MHPLDAPAAIATGLVLGLTSGGHCFWTCASVMGPYLVSTAPLPTGQRWSTVPSALSTLAFYQLGRLAAYLAAGLLALGLALTRARLSLPPGLHAALLGGTAAVLGWSLVRSLRSRPAHASGTRLCPGQRGRSSGAFAMGLLQGLTPCPPFLAALGLALSASNPAAGLLLFLSLFAGTALLTLPLALLEPVRRHPRLFWLARALGALVCIHLVISALRLLV